MAKCTAWELQLVDSMNNHDKFYRVYVVGAQWMAQWGRNGTVGQFQVKGSTSESGAMGDAESQSYKKQGGGYDPVGGRVTFDMPDAYLTALKGHGQYMDNQFRNALRQSPTSPAAAPSAAAAEQRRLAREAKDVEEFKQTLLRMRDKARAPVAGRNPQVSDQKPGEPETPPETAPTKSPIELALAKAIAAKKETT